RGNRSARGDGDAGGQSGRPSVPAVPEPSRMAGPWHYARSNTDGLSGGPLLGTLLPDLAELGIAADGKAGMRTALLYLANILGAAAGSILTGFFLMDHMGILAIAVALVVAGSLCTAVFVWLLNLPRAQKYLRTGVAAAVGALSVFLIPGLAEHVLENLQWKGA